MDPILLTAFEAKVVTRLFQGWRREQIAAEMHCAEATVNYHLHRVYRKAGVKSDIGLVAKAWKNGGYLY